MSRHGLVNVLLAVVTTALVGTALYLELADSAPAGSVASATTSTTTSSTSTTSPTSTTTTPTTTTPTTSSSSATSSTSTSSTTTTSTSTTTTLPPTSRDRLPVLVVNGSTQGERLPPIVALLDELGYPGVRGVVGAVQTTESTVYVIDKSLRGAGEVLAKDVGLRRRDVRLLSNAPPIAGLGNAVMIVYLGGK